MIPWCKSPQTSKTIIQSFKRGFGDAVSPMCGCNAEIEDTEHFLLRCHFYSIQRFELFNDMNKVELSFTQLDTKD